MLTAEQYKQSLTRLNPIVYAFGKKIENIGGSVNETPR